MANLNLVLVGAPQAHSRLKAHLSRGPDPYNTRVLTTFGGVLKEYLRLVSKQVRRKSPDLREGGPKPRPRDEIRRQELLDARNRPVAEVLRTFAYR